MITTLSLTDQTIVELYPLHIGDEVQGEHEVGRAETGTFISLPPEGVYLLHLLRSQLPLGKVKELFATRYSQEPDVDDFLEGMLSCGFIHKVDDQVIQEMATDDEMVRPPRGWYVLGNLSSKYVSWLASTPMLLFYLAIWLVVPLLFILRPALWPSPTKALVLPSVLGNAVLLALLGWGLAGIHEVAHTLAAKAYGCASFVTISHRLYFLVAQTDMTSVRTLPPKQRYGPYLAGMTCDMGILLLCLCWQLLVPSIHLTAACVYLLVVGLFSQCAFFMRTDIYYVFTNFFRLGNLMQDTQHWLLNLVSQARGRPPVYNLHTIPHRELRLIRYYAVFYLLGIFVALGEFILLGLPLLVAFLHLALNNLAEGPTQAAFWDGMAFIVLILLNFGLLFFLIWQDHFSHREQNQVQRT